MGHAPFSLPIGPEDYDPKKDAQGAYVASMALVNKEEACRVLYDSMGTLAVLVTPDEWAQCAGSQEAHCGSAGGLYLDFSSRGTGKLSCYDVRIVADYG